MNRALVSVLALGALVVGIVSVAVAGDRLVVPRAKTSDSPWRSLLEPSSANSWRGWNSSGFPDGWRVTAGVLAKDGSVDDLVTREVYGDFELQLEWKLGKAGNSGIFYRGTRDHEHIYWSAPEYQLLDDANAHDGQARLTSAAAAYALYAAPAGIVTAAR